MKKSIHILHLYPDLMNLYGERGNPDILSRMLVLYGYAVTVSNKSIGDDVDFDLYDFVYIGSGTERSQQACMQDLKRHKRKLIKKIENGLFVLATGNSHELFGQSITTKDGVRYKTLGLLDFETIQQNSRITGDCIYSASFTENEDGFETTYRFDIIGFINRAGGGQFDIQNDADKKHLQALNRPFTVKTGPGAGNGLLTEGILYKNLLGTYVTGPVLVRNPPLLEHYIRNLTCKTPNEPDLPDNVINSPVYIYQNEAYKVALGELLHR